MIISVFYDKINLELVTSSYRGVAQLARVRGLGP